MSNRNKPRSSYHTVNLLQCKSMIKETIVVNHGKPKRCNLVAASHKYSNVYNIIDISTTHPVVVNIFAHKETDFPVIVSVGDIIRCSGVKIQEYNGEIQLVNYKDASKFATAHRRINLCTGLMDEVEDKTFGDWCFRNNKDEFLVNSDDMKIISALHTFAQHFLFRNSLSFKFPVTHLNHLWPEEFSRGNRNVASSTSSASEGRDLDVIGMVVCTVMTNDRAGVYLWDGSTPGTASWTDVNQLAPPSAAGSSSNSSGNSNSSNSTTRRECDLQQAPVCSLVYTGIKLAASYASLAEEVPEATLSNKPVQDWLLILSENNSAVADKCVDDLLVQAHDSLIDQARSASSVSSPSSSYVCTTDYEKAGLMGCPLFFVTDSTRSTDELTTDKAIIAALQPGMWIKLRNLEKCKVAAAIPSSSSSSSRSGKICWSSESAAARPVGFITKFTHTDILLPYHKDVASIMNEYCTNRLENVAAAVAAQMIALNTSTAVPPTPVPATLRPLHRSESTRSSHSEIDVQSRLCACLSFPPPAKFCCRAFVLSWWPEDISKFAVPWKSLSVGSGSTAWSSSFHTKSLSLRPDDLIFMFALRIRDDTAITDVILFDEDAEFFLGVDAASYQNNTTLQTTIRAKLQELIETKALVNFHLKSYCQPAKLGGSRNGSYDTALRRFRVFDTTL